MGKQELDPRLVNLIDEHFPKGESKERGAAMVLMAEFLLWHEEKLKAKIPDESIESLWDTLAHSLSDLRHMAAIKDLRCKETLIETIDKTMEAIGLTQ